MWLRIAALLAWAGTLFGQPVAKLYTVSVLAGAPHTYPDGVPAMGALFESVSGVWASGSGEILITDADNHCVRRILADGTIRTVAGVCGKSGYSGSGKPALESLLNRPAVAVEDRQGNIYIADTGNSRIRKVTPEGVMTDYAGTGDFGLSGDEGPAANARLGNPVSLWLDAAGNLYFADPAFNVVRKVWANGRISRVAGNGVPGVADTETYGPEARINLPYGITGDAEGNVYFCERGNHAIRKVAPDGTMRLVAGLRKPGFGGDGGKATDGLLNSPTGVALDRQGNLYISDTGNHVIRKVSPAGVITTVAGVRPGNTPNFGTFGDGGPALAAALNQPLLITLDRNGDLLIADSGNRRVRLLVLSSPAPTLRTVAGRWQDIGDGGPARAAGLYRPHGVAVDKAGNVFIADTGNNRIRKVSPEGMITTVAGDGEAGFRGDGQNAARAMLSAPWDLVFDAAGHLLFSDRDNFRVRRISPEGVIQTVAGSGEPSDTPGALNIREAALWLPLSLAVDPKGYAYVSTNGRVRQLDFTFGHIRDFAGRPFAPFLFGGDSGPAVEALIGYATGIAADSLGSIWISDGPNQVVREVDRDNRIHSRVGFPLRSGYSGDGGFAGAARLNYPAALAFDQPGNLYIVDSGNHRIRRLNTAGIMETIAGGGKGFQEGAFATAVEFDDLGGMTVAGDGSIYLVEKARHRVLKLTPVFPATLRITTGDLQEGPAGRQLPGPLSVTVTDASGRVLIPGVGVKFSTVYGAAALSAAEVVTDANGAASVTVTLGNQAGPVTVRAEADGLAPVTFRLTATAPLAAAPPAVTQYSATRLAGAPRRRDGEPQTALFDHPEGVALDAAGNLYVADTRNHQIRKISPDGMVSTVAGTGAPGYSGDGGPATAAELNGPRSPGVAEDGSVYFVDAWNHVVRRISPEGVITTVFGNGQRGYSGDGRTGPEAQLNSPTALALAPSGLLVADAGNFRVRRLGTDGLVRTVAGTGVAGFSGDFGSPVLARISAVSSLAVDTGGNVFLADTGNHRIRRLRTPGSLIDTYAGNGKPGFGPEGAKAAEAALGSPGGLAVGADGSLYAATEGRIARVRNTGELETYTEAASPGLLSAGPDGALYFTSGNKVWKIDAATRSAVWLAGAEHVGGDGGPAAEAIFDSPNAVLATAGGILVADPAAGNIRRIAPDGNIATLLDASSGIRTPAGMAADAEGNLYVSDQKSGAVFRLTPGGELTTIAPEGSFTSPAGLASDAAGNLYVADMGGHVIRKVGRDGTISTVAGTGKAGYNGDGRPGPLAQIDRPYGLALDAAGNLYFTEAGGHRVRRLAPSGVIYTVAGAGKPGFSGDGGPAAAAQLDSPSGIAVDAEGNLYVADSGNLRLRKISPSGGIASVEGMTLPQAATLFSLDGGGRIYIADPTAGSVRALAPLTR
jgi:sugar lactone lactonase YvrE